MTMAMSPDDNAERQSEHQADLTCVMKALQDPATINVPDAYGDTPLVKAIRLHDSNQRLHYVQALIVQGADVNWRGDDGGGDALFAAVLNQDADVLEFLLSHGANPNYILDPLESLYDWAEFDYRYEAWDLNAPIASTEFDRQSENHWLDYLERCAIMAGVGGPKHLRVLRAHGALRRKEMERE